MYQKEKHTKEMEITLRETIRIIRSTLDTEQIKRNFLQIACNYFDADRGLFAGYDQLKGEFLPFDIEVLKNDEIKSLVGISVEESFPEFANKLKNKKRNIIIKDVKKIILINKLPNYKSLQTLQQSDTKSDYGLLVQYNDEILGILILHYINDKRTLTSEELDFLKVLKDQAGIGLHQAAMYEKEKLMVERERISRNIVEILRSSIDKTIIKKLFVKNIGKFFSSDRVFFSEYDSQKNMYLPVDKDSEYLSSPEEKSFIGYDWSNPEIRDHIQPLLDKRESNIFDLDEYIHNNPYHPHLINLLKEYDIKSTYNFPVLYQNHIMGFFSIEFTQRVVRLSDEEVDRIRRMCTQAGIALYHADLYLKAQQYHMTRKNFVADVSQKIIEPTNNILDRSILLSKNEFERAIQIRYLNSIISSCNELIELTKNISDDYIFVIL